MARLGLHEAIVVAMVRARQWKMLPDELANAINRDRLYLRKDRQPLPSLQILRRARRETYRDLFRVRGPKGAKTVSLRRPRKLPPEPLGEE
jgi:hypothetical protein